MDACDKCTNLGGKKSCRWCCHLCSRPKLFQTTHVCSNLLFLHQRIVWKSVLYK